MQITLNHEEILTALDTYVRSQINIADNQEIEIDMKAGRGDNGYSATLDIVQSKSKAPAKPKPVYRSAEKPVQAEPEEVTSEEVAEATPEEVKVDEAPKASKTSIFKTPEPEEEEAPKAETNTRSIFSKASA